MRSTRRAFLQAAVGAAVTASSHVAHAECPGPDPSQSKVAVLSVEARLELRLADGRLIRLAGLDPALQTPDAPDLAETTRARAAAMIAGKPIILTVLAAAPDRWGRFPARVFPEGNSAQAGGFATALIAAGLGRYLAEPAAHACRDALMAAERVARSAKLGLWADPYYAVLAVDDRAGFAERSGTIVVAEGRLTAVETSPYRTTLRFAAPARSSQGGPMLVATIPPRVMKTFEAQQIDLRALIGRRVQFRGLLDLRFGPRIALDGPDAIDVDPHD